MNGPRVLVLGASGDQGRRVSRLLAEHEPHLSLTLAARHERRLGGAVGDLGATLRPLDLLDRASLRAAVEEADLVVNAAGPYLVTAAPVMSACSEEGVDYLDFQDDPESVEAARALAPEAGRNGAALLVCCGASPGLYNLMARDLCDEFDAVDTVDFGWVVGDEGARRPGEGALRHMLHVMGRTCVRHEDGEERRVEPMAATSAFPIHGLGAYELYEVGHPEPMTLPAVVGGVRRVRCFGGLHPEPQNGLLGGLAAAVERGDLELDRAVEFIQDVADDGTGSLGPWRHALAGARRLHPLSQIGRMLARGAVRRHTDFTGGLAVRVRGERDGAAASIVRRTSPWGPETFWTSFDEVNGRAVAAFVSLAAESPPGPGLLYPEAWAGTGALLDRMARHGAPRDAIVDPADVAEGAAALSPPPAR